MFLRALTALAPLLLAMGIGLAPTSASAQLAGLGADGRHLVIIGEDRGRVMVTDVVRLKTEPSDRIVAMDLRAADGELYGFSAQGDLYRINVRTGALTKKFAFASVLPGVVSMDCDGGRDACRLVSDGGFNASFTFKDGVLLVDSRLSYERGGASPRVAASACAKSFPGSPRGDLIAIDAAKDKLFEIRKPKSGVMSPIGDARPRVEPPVAFDIVSYGPGDNVASAVLGRSLYRYDFGGKRFRKLAEIEGLDVDLRDLVFLFARR